MPANAESVGKPVAAFANSFRVVTSIGRVLPGLKQPWGRRLKMPANAESVGKPTADEFANSFRVVISVGRVLPGLKQPGLQFVNAFGVCVEANTEDVCVEANAEGVCGEVNAGGVRVEINAEGVRKFQPRVPTLGTSIKNAD